MRTTILTKISFSGLRSLPLNNGSVPRKNQLQAIQELETKQLRILFGVCLLFIVCHTCRILLNIEDLYLRLINGIDPTKSRPCNEGCASYYSFWSHVSLITTQDNKRLSIIIIKHFGKNHFHYFFKLDDGNMQQNSFGHLTFVQSHHLLSNQ